MNTKTIVTIVVTFLILISAILGAYFYINNQKVTSEDGERSFFDTIFPFGGTPDRKIDTLIEEPQTEVSESGDSPKLRHISSFPIAGMFTFINDESEEVVRYVEKGTGHIYETKTFELGQEKISNTTIPRIYEAIWLNESEIILRYFNEEGDLESFYAELEDGSLGGSFIEKNIGDIKVVGNTIRYLSETSSGSSIIRSAPDGSSRTTLYNSEFSEWNVDWWNSSLAILTTKPSGLVNGSSFFLNVNSGNLTKIFDSLPGLSILPDTKSDDILFSTNIDGLTLSYVIDTETEDVSSTNISLIPEKCVWAERNLLYCSVPIEFEDGLYPDDWYKGLVSFNDDLWSINTKEGNNEVIQYLDDEIDGINLTLSPSGDYLLFTNKKDSTLWSLRLED